MRAALLKILGGLVAGLVLVGALLVANMWWDSRLPSAYSAMEMGELDYGGGPAPAGRHERHLSAILCDRGEHVCHQTTL